MENQLQSKTVARYHALRKPPKNKTGRERGPLKIGFSLSLLPLIFFLAVVAPNYFSFQFSGFSHSEILSAILPVCYYSLGFGLLFRLQIFRIFTLFAAKVLIFCYILFTFLVLINFGDLNFQWIAVNENSPGNDVMMLLVFGFALAFPVLAIKILNQDSVKQNFGLNPWDN